MGKLRPKSIIIPAELHEKLARYCEPINEVDSQVVRVRPVPKKSVARKGVERDFRAAVCHWP